MAMRARQRNFFCDLNDRFCDHAKGLCRPGHCIEELEASAPSDIETGDALTVREQSMEIARYMLSFRGVPQTDERVRALMHRPAVIAQARREVHLIKTGSPLP